MAENTCGPSNALQNIQKHTSHDRTLQQDRLTTRQPFLQGLRPLSHQATSSAKIEFEAFQNDRFFPEATIESQAFSCLPPKLTHPEIPNWASDFQQLSLAQPQLHTSAFQSSQAQGYHGTDEQQFHNKNIPISTSLKGFRSMGLSSNYGFNYGAMSRENNTLHHQTMEKSYEAEEFARAFDEVALSYSQTTLESHQENEAETCLDEPMDESTERTLSLEDNIHLTQARIGADIVDDEKLSDEEESNCLSIIASKLLNSLNHEQSSKFQNSQFLDLMRQFRDKEATVEGGKVIVSRNK
ncbi:unnamed protein product [Blumeria hordei]|uniref:Peroxin 20 n=2 Tax=Blumeria hordei TaxID=2867405 RepID=A0A383UY86_BLUHO|nr:peroxin 20 [Blumeria hordei DH14]SZF04545.1 unnamed protein product [Blumeria hordei]